MSTFANDIQTLRSLPTTNYCVVDVETHGLAAKLKDDATVYFACTLYVGSEGNPKMRTWWCIDDLVEYLRFTDCDLVYHNSKFDHAVLQLRGLNVPITRVYDTQVLAYLENNQRREYSLDALTGEKEDIIAALVEEGLVPEGTDKRVFWNTDHSQDDALLRRLVGYCKKDVLATYKLYKSLLSRVPASVVNAYHLVDQPMLEALINLEQHGALINQSLLQEILDTTGSTIRELEETIADSVGLCPKLQFDGSVFVPFEKTYASGVFKNKLHVPPFYTDNQGVFVRQWGDDSGNLHIDNGEPLVVGSHCPLLPFNSSPATGHVWWVINNTCPEVLERVKETKGGKPKINKDFISDIADALPESFPIGKLAKQVKRYQMATTIANNVQEDGRIRCDFAHTRTLTGRLATSNPNLQNLPRAGKDEDSQVFRKLFVPAEGNVLLCADLNN